MLVLIGKLLLSTFRWVPICQGFSHFPVFLHYFVLAKLATSSIRVKAILEIYQIPDLFFLKISGYLVKTNIVTFSQTIYYFKLDWTSPSLVKGMSRHGGVNPYLANTKWSKSSEKWLKLWHMGTHLRVLRESYPMNTNMTGFRGFTKSFASLCFGRK